MKNVKGLLCVACLKFYLNGAYFLNTQNSKDIKLPMPLSLLPMSQSCDSEAMMKQLIEIFGINLLPVGIIELFAIDIWQKDANIWLWFTFSIASCIKFLNRLCNSGSNMKSERQCEYSLH